MNSQIIIHQTLHGYRDGHRLLASSFELSRNSERQLFNLSDLSGDGFVKGFEEYITGYQLPDKKNRYYALAKTWYAPEMERPGCVWTHTLIINIEDLYFFNNVEMLLSVFERPKKGQSFSHYTNTINFPYNNSSPNLTNYHIDPLASEQLFRKLFYTIYQYKRNAVILSENANTFTSLILKFWLQNWPELRANFSFCTGALSPRKLGESQYITLQVTPEKNHYLFNNLSSDKINKSKAIFDIIDPLSKSNKAQKLNEWYNIPISCLLNYHANESSSDLKEEQFYKFLWEFGPTLPALRTSFSRLTQIFWRMQKILTGRQSLSDLTELFNLRYPKPSDGASLKSAIYGNMQAWSFVVSKATEPNLKVLVLDELIRTKYYYIFNIDELNLEERIANLWEQHKDQAIEVFNTCLNLSTDESNPIREAFFQATAKYAPAEVLLPLAKHKTDLLETILSINTRLSESPILWSLNENPQRYVFAKLQSTYEKEISETKNVKQSINWESIATAMLAANTDLFAENLEQYLSGKLVPLILDWYKSTNTKNLPHIGYGWKRVLEAYPKEQIEWVQHNVKRNKSHQVMQTCALVASLSDISNYDTWNAGPDIWLNLAKFAKNNLLGDSKLHVMTFILSAGLTYNNKSACKLVTYSFQTVYDAAQLDMIPWLHWSKLDRLAPSHGFIFSWDKCHRLEEALITKIVVSKWPAETLVSSVTSIETFRQLIKRADDSSKGRKLIWKLYDGLKAGRLKFDTAISKIICKYCS